MATYRITFLAGDIVSTVFPPRIVSVAFPAYGEGWEVRDDLGTILVTAPSPQTPADLGPLVKVEQLSQ